MLSPLNASDAVNARRMAARAGVLEGDTGEVAVIRKTGLRAHRRVVVWMLAKLDE